MRSKMWGEVALHMCIGILMSGGDVDMPEYIVRHCDLSMYLWRLSVTARFEVSMV